MKKGKGLIPLMIVVFALSFAFSNASAEDVKFPNKSVEQLSSAELRKYKEEIFAIVLGKMKLEFNPNISLPKVLKEDEITQEEFNKIHGFEFDQKFPCYVPQGNNIILRNDSKLDTLAHEYVHYFQVMYQGATELDNIDDRLEVEAVQIQHWFKKNYLK